MQWRRTRLGLTAQLMLSYWLVGILAALCAVIFSPLHLQIRLLIICAGLAGILPGCVLTFNLQRNFWRIERALAKLAQGQPVTKLDPHWQWPLTALFTHIRQINQVITEQNQRATQTAEQHDQLLCAISEIAVQ